MLRDPNTLCRMVEMFGLQKQVCKQITAYAFVSTIFYRDSNRVSHPRLEEMKAH